MKLKSIGPKPKKTGRRYVRQCKGKKQYGSKEMAYESVKSAKERGYDNSIDSYWCEYCKKWHIGHVDKTNNGSDVKETGKIRAGTIVKMNGIPVMLLADTPYFTMTPVSVSDQNRGIEGSQFGVQ